MAKLTKRMKAIAEKVDKDKVYPIEEAVNLLNDLSKTKMKESIDISVNLGVDPRKSDQNVRGATTLPHGTGKSCLLYTSPSPRDRTRSRMPSSA